MDNYFANQKVVIEGGGSWQARMSGEPRPVLRDECAHCPGCNRYMDTVDDDYCDDCKADAAELREDR